MNFYNTFILEYSIQKGKNIIYNGSPIFLMICDNMKNQFAFESEYYTAIRGEVLVRNIYSKKKLRKNGISFVLFYIILGSTSMLVTLGVILEIRNVLLLITEGDLQFIGSIFYVFLLFIPLYIFLIIFKQAFLMALESLSAKGPTLCANGLVNYNLFKGYKLEETFVPYKDIRMVIDELNYEIAHSYCAVGLNPHLQGFKNTDVLGKGCDGQAGKARFSRNLPF